MCTPPPEETIEHMAFHCQFIRECWASLKLVWQSGNTCQIIEQGKLQWTGPMFMEVFIVGA
jgi:hypothetical protein